MPRWPAVTKEVGLEFTPNSSALIAVLGHGCTVHVQVLKHLVSTTLPNVSGGSGGRLSNARHRRFVSP